MLKLLIIILSVFCAAEIKESEARALTKVGDVIDDVKDLLQIFISFYSSWAYDVVMKINDGQLNISKQIIHLGNLGQNLTQTFQDIADQSAKGKECIETYDNEIGNFTHETVVNEIDCITVATNTIDDLNNKSIVIILKVSDIALDVEGRLTTCLNISTDRQEQVNCLNPQWNEIHDEIYSERHPMEAFRKLVDYYFPVSMNKLDRCIEKSDNICDVHGRALLDKINKCINNSTI